MKRRELLALAARAGLSAAAIAALPPLLREALAASPGPSLIERNAWPKHWETSLAALDESFLTPNETFFVRSHLAVPVLRVRDWRLSVGGLVRDTSQFTLGQLRAMPQHEITCTLECAGNGRGLYHLANTSGTQWEYGAVGTARWRGVRLADLLARVGAADDATDIWFEAADESPFGTVPKFVRSVPAAKARGDVLLALEMNGEPLPPLHGAPCRAIVPGWYGMASTKWLTGLSVQNRPSSNHFMTRGYRYAYPGENPATAPAVEDIRVKSLITSVGEGDSVAIGTLALAGWAWSGRAIARVEVSDGAMAAWREARLGTSAGDHAWRRWECDVAIAAPGSATFAVRATDVAGETQPVAARPNAAGYANNSIHRVAVHARG